MRSGSSERTPSLRGRVAWTTGLSALVGGTLVALVGGLLGWGLAIGQEDRRLKDALDNLSFELDETDGSEQAIAGVGRDEQAEIAHTGVRLGIFRGNRRLSGTLAAPASAGCSSVSDRGTARRCAERAGANLLVAESSMAALDTWLRLSGGALVLAVLFVGALAAWGSRRAASVAIEPLGALTSAVSRVDAGNPDARAVAAPIACAEVELLRGEFHRLLTDLSESLAQARRFGSNAAHELRTPLAALRAEVELLSEEVGVEASKGALAAVHAHVLELGDRLDRVLILAHPTFPGGAPTEPVSMDTVAREVIAALDAGSRARVSVPTDDEGLVGGDPVLLRMLVRNAVENALKFTASAVRVRVTSAADVVTVSVEDEGPGLAQDERERVFEPFYRLKSSVSAQPYGMGLGLALIAHIAKMHGGSAGFEPAARGAQLSVRLAAWHGRA